MKKSTLFIFLFFFTCGFRSYSQFIQYPDINHQSSDRVSILDIDLTGEYTVIHFLYSSSPEYINGGWVNIRPEVFIKDSYGSQKLKLIKAKGIPIAPQKKNFEFAGQFISYKLFFPKINRSVEEIDIIECSETSCFNFYGVSLNRNQPVENETFRRDYNHVAFYDPENQKWSEWQKAENTFVLNFNENADIAHYMANGEMVVYKKVSNIEMHKLKLRIQLL